ncbi:MAG: hypothetical protein PHS68_05740 [Candidatus Izemoplasmatales bacterium]|nr:hypothetical protein [Candidatus Izemoplasmatales bacterium]
MNIDSGVLSSAVKKACRAVDEKHHIEQLRNVCFRGGYLYGYNQRFGVKTKLDLSLDCCLPADRLNSVVANLKDEVKIYDGKGVVEFKNKSFKAKIKKFPSDAFPDIIPKTVQKLSGTPLGLIPAIMKVLPCASDSIEPPTLHGIAVTGSYAYASDNNGSYMIRAELPRALSCKFVIPKDAAKRAVSFGEPDTISSNQSVVVFEHKDIDTTVVCAQWSHDFPTGALDMISTQPINESHTVQLPDGLSVALKKVCSVSPGQIDAKVALVETRNGELVISCDDDIASSTSESLPWPYDFDISFRMKALHLWHAVKVCRYANFSSILSESPRLVRFWDGTHTQSIAINTGH